MSKFLGNNIRTLRNYYNESREELAEILGFELSTISNYELGYRVPDEDTLKKIAKHFNISVDVLMNEDVSIIKSIYLFKSAFKKSQNITFKFLLFILNNISFNLVSISKHKIWQSFFTSPFVIAPAPGPISTIKSSELQSIAFKI